MEKVALSVLRLFQTSIFFTIVKGEPLTKDSKGLEPDVRLPAEWRCRVPLSIHQRK